MGDNNWLWDFRKFIRHSQALHNRYLEVLEQLDAKEASEKSAIIFAELLHHYLALLNCLHFGEAPKKLVEYSSIRDWLDGVRTSSGQITIHPEHMYYSVQS